MAQVLETVKLIYVDVRGNNNKVWQADLRDDGVLVQWGRVGAKLQNKLHSNAGRSKFEILRREKLGKGYEYAQTVDVTTLSSTADLKTIALEQIKADDTAKGLINYLTETNIHDILAGTTLTYQGSGTFTTPLGAVTPGAIAQARTLLDQLASGDGDRVSLLNQYLRLVPQKLSSRLDDRLFATPKALQAQTDLLDALAAVLPTVTTSDRVFDCSLEVVPHTTREGRKTFRHVKQMFESSINVNHASSSLKLKRVYGINLPALATQFEVRLGNVQPLWHGTRSSNLLSILKNGLIIPPASASQCTGRMFGNGLYFSNQSTKSLNYATSYWNRSGSTEQRTFMLLADVALGREYRPKTRTADVGSGKLPKGYDSLWVEPGSCSVMNQEAIVYRTSQCNLRYLCEFS
jgi:poly [ADP-ribose] polymerase